MDKEKMQIYSVTAIIGVIIFFYFLTPSPSQNTAGTDNIIQTGTAQNGQNGNVQVVELSYKNGNYYPQAIKLKQNIPAQIVVDMNTVRGCMTSIRIPKFGVQKTVTKSDNIITFTPTEKGEFLFSCSMGMGTGKIIVE